MSATDVPTYDVVVVGSGPAGISLCLRLAERSGARVLMVESGGLEVDPQVQKLAAVEAEGRFPAHYFKRHSLRLFGGTSNIWTGYCATLERRAFSASDWPIAYSDLMRYYREAAPILELPEEAYQRPVRELTPDGDLVYKPFYRSPPVRFGQKYWESISRSPNIEVALGVTCVGLRHREGRITSLLVENSSPSRPKRRAIRARRFVLACGGLGNPRMLLVSGLAPRSPVGRYLSEHPHIYSAGELELRKDVVDAVLSPHDVVHALQLSSQFDLDHDLLNYSVAFDTRRVERRLLLGTYEEVYVSTAVVRAEMPLDSSNRVALSDTLDATGTRRARIQFEFRFREAAARSWSAFSRRLLRLGVGRATTPPPSYPAFEGGGHFCATTRMGLSARDSVVDSNCRVHGLENLYLAGSSVFPAVGAANPTFSIVALALRLADHLADRYRG